MLSFRRGITRRTITSTIKNIASENGTKAKYKVVPSTDVIKWTSFEGTEAFTRYKRLSNGAAVINPIIMNDRIEKAGASAILRLFESHGFSYSRVNLATSIYKAVCDAEKNNNIFHLQAEERLHHMLALAADNARYFDLQSLCNITSAITKLKVMEGTSSLMILLIKQLVNIPDDEFDVLDISHLAITLSKAGKCNQEVKVSPHTEILFRKICSLGIKKIEFMKPEELSSVCLGFSEARQPDDPSEFFDAVAKRLSDRKKYQSTTFLEKFPSKHLSNTLWAFANANQSQSSLFQYISTYMLGNSKFLKGMTPEDISKVFMAYSSLETRNTALLKEMISLSKSLMLKFQVQHIETMVKAWNLWNVDDLSQEEKSLCQSFFVSLENQQYFLCNGSSAQQLCNIVYGYGKNNVESKKFLPEAVLSLTNHVDGKQPPFDELCKALWSFSHIGCNSDTLLRSIINVFHNDNTILSTLTTSQLSRLLWSISEREYYFTDDFVIELQNMITQLQSNLSKSNEKVSLSTALQLHQISLSLRLQVPIIGSKFDQKQIWLAKHLQTADKINNQVTPSNYINDIAKILTKMNIGSEKSFPLEGYSIDLMVSTKKTALLINNSSAYTCNRNLTGYHRLKERHLKLLGWNVASIPSWKWDSVKVKEKVAIAYLNNIFFEVEKKSRVKKPVINKGKKIKNNNNTNNNSIIINNNNKVDESSDESSLDDDFEDSKPITINIDDLDNLDNDLYNSSSDHDSDIDTNKDDDEDERASKLFRPSDVHFITNTSKTSSKINKEILSKLDGKNVNNGEKKGKKSKDNEKSDNYVKKLWRPSGLILANMEQVKLKSVNIDQKIKYI